jgi:hypothetical protein
MKRYIYLTNSDGEYIYGVQEMPSAIITSLEDGSQYSITELIRQGWTITRTGRKPLQ